MELAGACDLGQCAWKPGVRIGSVPEAMDTHPTHKSVSSMGNPTFQTSSSPSPAWSREAEAGGGLELGVGDGEGAVVDLP